MQTAASWEFLFLSMNWVCLEIGYSRTVGYELHQILGLQCVFLCTVAVYLAEIPEARVGSSSGSEKQWSWLIHVDPIFPHENCHLMPHVLTSVTFFHDIPGISYCIPNPSPIWCCLTCCLTNLITVYIYICIYTHTIIIIITIIIVIIYIYIYTILES